MPTGLVTFLFTDIEGSTRLWEDRPTEMAVALARHDQLLRAIIQGGGGFVFKTVGDAFCAVFHDADSALLAALAAQRALGVEPWPPGIELRVRMALHSGRGHERDGDFFGPDVNRTARLERVAHGGQIICSSATAEMTREADIQNLRLRDLGTHLLKDLVGRHLSFRR
jgi:class 3 adenylate cyclase